MISPARILRVLRGAALSALFTAGPAAAQTIKVGVILSYSGPLALLGTQIERGLSLYIKEHERDLQGISLQIIRRDDQGRSEQAFGGAEELAFKDKVDFIVGGVTGSSATAIAQATLKSQVPFIALYAASNQLTRISPNVIRMSIAASQTSYAVGLWSARQGAKTGYVIVTDSEFGSDAEAAFTVGFSEGGAKVVGVERISLSLSFDSLAYVEPLLKIKSARPSLVFAFLPSGLASKSFLRRFDEIGLIKESVRLVGPQDLAADSILTDMGDEIRGLITAGSYSSAADRPQNRDFLAAWIRAYGDKNLPDFMAVAAWDAMAAIFEVIRQRKGRFSGDQALEILKRWKSDDSPRGPIYIDPTTREVVQDIYIRRVEIRGGRPSNVEFEKLPYKPALSGVK